MKPTVSIGNQDFSSIREMNYFYIDKTDFIRQWWESGDIVTLITRPRRFGKTLNMSMLECFFSNQCRECRDLFKGLSIWSSEKYRALQGSYPVIFLSLANVKEPDYYRTRRKICQLITNLYMKNTFLLEEGFLKDKERAFFENISVDMDDNAATMALHQLTDYLSRYYGKKVIILLDEYDTPLQEAYVNGFWNEMAAFIRSLFSASFKTNPFLERGLLTGITRISKESIFSDLNNLEVVTTTSQKYETAFGFTEKEVVEALRCFGFSDSFEKIKYWYDGFRFGKQGDIYNPWSITKYLDSGEFKSYWANTSSNLLVDKLIREGEPDIKIAMEALLCDGQIETEIDEEIIFEQLGDNSVAVWSLLLSTGYLKVVCAPVNESDNIYHLSLTNFEVKRMFRRMIQGWFGRKTTQYSDFIKALLADDVDYMNQYMNQIALKTFSSFDSGKKPSELSEPERFYHGFVLGLMIDLADRYQIKSNRESGFGRYDVMLEPLEGGQPAYVLEFKVRNTRREKNLEETVREALRQIDERDYDAELTCKGFPKEKIRHYGFAFEGKRVLIGK